MRPEATNYYDLPATVQARVRAGEVIELDAFEDGAGTWIEYVDVELDYLYPSFVVGDESVYERHNRALVNDAQDNHSV